MRKRNKYVFVQCVFNVCLCVLTQRSSQSETGQRVEGAHDGANCSDPHWDGVVVGVLWACWESPRLHQQQMLYPAYTHMQLPDQMYKLKCRNSIKTPHIYFFFYIWACSLFGKWCKKKKEKKKRWLNQKTTWNCVLSHTLSHRHKAPVWVFQRVGCRQVSSEVVSQQHHLLKPHLLPPLLQGCHKLILGLPGVGAELGTAAPAKAQQVQSVDRSTAGERIQVKSPEGDTTSEAVQQNQRSGGRGWGLWDTRGC